MSVRYLSAAETAKLVRRDLKAAFPHVKFSVRTHRGSSINVSWTDGPCTKIVESLIGHYHSRDFDGMIDMATSRYHWLLPDGEVVLAEVVGTTGSMGTISDYKRIAPHDDAELVSLGAGYLSCNRDLSAAYYEALALDVATKWGVPLDEIEFRYHDDGSAYMAHETSSRHVPNAHTYFRELFYRELDEQARAEFEAWKARQDQA